MAIYAAVDPSIRCTGLVAIELKDNGLFWVHDIKSLKPNHGVKDRLKKKLDAYDLFKWATENIPIYRECAFFVFENYSYASPGHLADLGEMNGMFKKHIIRDLKVPIDTIAPSSVKKLIVGSAASTSTKEKVRDNLPRFIENWDQLTISNLDESDAIAIGVAYALYMGVATDPDPPVIEKPDKRRKKKNESEEDTETS